MAESRAGARRKTRAGIPVRETGYPGKIRIIAGRWRGRRLEVPQAPGLRPTPDRVRETLFNWLAPHIEGARCLDLFAGTGALCLEALSRGAGEVIMVEQAPHAAQALRANLERLGAVNAEVANRDAVEYLGQPPAPFDIIFIDPPFQSDLVAVCAALIEERGWLKPGGLIYIETPSSLKPLPIPDVWELVRSKTAGQVGYHLVCRAPTGAASRP